MTAPAPDPSFRDQLAEWFHGGWCTDDHPVTGDAWCGQQADDLLAERFFAAEVERQAQAAANQRAAWELREAAEFLRHRAAALAQPAPQRAEQ